MATLYCDENKYAKKSAGLPLPSTAAAIGGLSLRDVSGKEVAQLLRNPFQAYAVFLMAVSVAYYCLGGSLVGATIPDLLGFVSVIAESLGLLALRHKIEYRQSVTGISGVAMSMYALVYLLRQVMLLPPLSWQALDGWAVEVLQIPSILMVLDVVRSVFKTYKNSYQEEMDVVKMKHLVPGCMVLAAFLHPTFRQGMVYSYFWTAYMYLDVMALLPQVVMMSRSGGKVEAPIAHFVAATALSRMVDLEFWYFRFDMGEQGYWFGVNYSGWLVVLVHIFSMVLVIDFMYYYIKARLAGTSFSEDLSVDNMI